MYFKTIGTVLVSFTVISLIFQLTLAAKPSPSKNRRLGVAERRKVSERFRSLSPVQVEQAKSEAVKSVESNLAQMLQVLSSRESTAPANVKAEINTLLKAVKVGQLTDSLKSSLPRFMMNNPRGNPAKQLGKLIGNLQESRKGRSQLLPLDGLMMFLKSNMGGTNTLLKNLVMGSPDLLTGALPAIMAPMGHLNTAVDGSMTSLSDLLGGLMGGNGLLG